MRCLGCYPLCPFPFLAYLLTPNDLSLSVCSRYDPKQVTTKGGNLVLQLDKRKNHDLDYVSLLPLLSLLLIFPDASLAAPHSGVFLYHHHLTWVDIPLAFSFGMFLGRCIHPNVEQVLLPRRKARGFRQASRFCQGGRSLARFLDHGQPGKGRIWYVIR